jgi:pyruvate formate lyase activating enzyme
MLLGRRSRREFLFESGFGALAAGAGLHGLGAFDSVALAADPLDELIRLAPRARYWISAASEGVTCASCHVPGEVEGKPGFRHAKAPVRCLLCARNCLIVDGDRGMCRARYNHKGELRTLVYGRPISIHVDPIEKKPFYHFLPGSAAFSMATSGCPLRCKFCQNWEISQARPEDYGLERFEPRGIVEAAEARRAPVIAFTYNEPTVFTEYLTDIARAGRSSRLRHVMISCGFMNEAPLGEMCGCLDAIKIDLKGFSPGFYRDVCGAELEPVLRSIKQVARAGIHLELVNLVVPTLNDSETMLRELAGWVMGEIGPDVPIHFTRFHPDYQLRNLPPTPIATLERARAIALERGIHYAFVGNVPGHPGNHTYCPRCGEVVIERMGFFVTATRLAGGRCAKCRLEIAGVWS